LLSTAVQRFGHAATTAVITIIPFKSRTAIADRRSPTDSGRRWRRWKQFRGRRTSCVPLCADQ